MKRRARTGKPSRDRIASSTAAENVRAFALRREKGLPKTLRKTRRCCARKPYLAARARGVPRGGPPPGLLACTTSRRERRAQARVKVRASRERGLTGPHTAAQETARARVWRCPPPRGGSDARCARPLPPSPQTAWRAAAARPPARRDGSRPHPNRPETATAEGAGGTLRDGACPPPAHANTHV